MQFRVFTALFYQDMSITYIKYHLSSVQVHVYVVTLNSDRKIGKAGQNVKVLLKIHNVYDNYVYEVADYES